MTHIVTTGKIKRESFAGIKESEADIDFSKTNEGLLPPNLIDIQIDSYNNFLENGLKEIFNDYSPIVSKHKKHGEIHFNFVSYEINMGEKIYVSKDSKFVSIKEKIEEIANGFDGENREIFYENYIISKLKTKAARTIIKKNIELTKNKKESIFIVLEKSIEDLEKRSKGIDEDLDLYFLSGKKSGKKAKKKETKKDKDGTTKKSEELEESKNSVSLLDKVKFIFKDCLDLSDREILNLKPNKKRWFEDFKISIVIYNEEDAKKTDATYESALYVNCMQENKESGVIEEKKIYFGSIPLMTKRATFIWNGAERVIVSQLGRSPGIFFELVASRHYVTGRGKQVIVKPSVRISPYRGTWLEIESKEYVDKVSGEEYLKHYISVDKNKKVPLSVFFKYLSNLPGYEEKEINEKGVSIVRKKLATNEGIAEIFDYDSSIIKTAEKDGIDEESDIKNAEIAALDLYDKIRPRQHIPPKEAIKFINSILFNGKRYDFDYVGRYKTNEKIMLSAMLEHEKDAGNVFELSRDCQSDITGEIIGKAGDVLDEKLIKKLELNGVLSLYIKFKTEDDKNELLLRFNGMSSAPIGDIIKHLMGKKLHKDFLAQISFDSAIHVPTLNNLLVSLKSKRGDKLFSKENLTLEDERTISSAIKKYKSTLTGRHILPDDIVATTNYLLNLYKGFGEIDDIDHLGNRRVRTVGELVLSQFRAGMQRIDRAIRDKLTAPKYEDEGIYVSYTPLYSALKDFFGLSQLSQFMDEQNPLSEITNKRRLSAFGPGGLKRESVGYDVRNIHYSHYGRICPIETPEGQNIGLITTLSSFARISKFGFIETPYKEVKDGKITGKIIYLTADKEDKKVIAHANEPIDSKTKKFVHSKVEGRGVGGDIKLFNVEDIELMDVSPKQLISVATALIPFLENDDANRALMGANMQRQAVPLLVSEAPRVGTGMEWVVARDSGATVIAKKAGEVTYVDADKICVKNESNRIDDYNLLKFKRTNQATTINQKPIVKVGEKVKAGEVIADGPAIKNAELALGKNLLVGFMTFHGYNYEDAIVLNENVVKKDTLTSFHIEKYDLVCRETKLGDEEITRDIPGVKESLLVNLDETGVINIGTEVRSGDILVGKLTPKGETEKTNVDKVLETIFGKKAREIKDSSLKLPNGGDGTVVGVHRFNAEDDNLGTGVIEKIRVFVAAKRKISVGDKLAGRHGNKGVVSTILPEEEMPFLDDGKSLDILLNPLGVPSRMNIGQVLEVHLGLIAYKENKYYSTPVFDGATPDVIIERLKEAGLPENGKLKVRDGRTGEYFDKPITVGYMYILKLHHLVAEKIHARSTGPHAKVTQQPLGGKANMGGQRFGEMEVWALEAYGAAHTLKEMLTIKSDDVRGREKINEMIIEGKGGDISSTPESFKVLLSELKALGINITLEAGGKEVDVIDSAETPNFVDKMLKEVSGNK